ncbi:winged helix-turn-helix domain-containing protein [Vibrio bivalvicida]|uniref:Transcriptional regulator n=1 Tax=Vibrio bivalvicida TaxID=1276888 RepID=A0ABV4MNY1_9VIBR
MLLINNKYILNALTGTLEERDSGIKVALGSNEVALLQFMIEHPNKPLSKAQLLDEVWYKKGVVVEESSLLHTVSTCRKALEDRSGEIITTVRGVGYQFNGHVESYQPKEIESPIIKRESSADEPKQLKRNNTVYLIAFTLSAAIGFLAYTLFSSPWVEADYQESRYVGCVIPQPGKDEPMVMNNVRAFTSENQTILVDQDGRSISFIPSDVEVDCE